MFPPTLDFTGAVTYHFPDKDNIGVRMFGVNLSIYKEKQDSQVVTESCRILCMFDDGNARWKSNNIPALNRVLHVTGVVLGFYNTDGRVSLCLTISELSYISISSAAPVVSPTPATATVSPSQGRLRIWSGVTTSPLASKKRRLSTPEPEASSSTTLHERRQSESPTSSLLEQLQTAVEQTKHDSGGTRPKRRISKRGA
jgi:hypothetical protein